MSSHGSKCKQVGVITLKYLIPLQQATSEKVGLELGISCQEQLNIWKSNSIQHNSKSLMKISEAEGIQLIQEEIG